MTRRGKIESLLREIDKTERTAIKIGLSVRLVQEYIRPEFRALWAVLDMLNDPETDQGHFECVMNTYNRENR